DFYELQDDGTFQRRRSGGSVPYWDPERTARHCAFDVTLEPGKTLTTYLRVKDCFRLPSQFSFWPNADPFVRWERFIASTNLAYACLWGGMTAFGIFLYALLRERAQRHYVIFLLAIGGVHFI